MIKLYQMQQSGRKLCVFFSFPHMEAVINAGSTVHVCS